MKRNISYLIDMETNRDNLFNENNRDDHLNLMYNTIDYRAADTRERDI